MDESEFERSLQTQPMLRQEYSMDAQNVVEPQLCPHWLSTSFKMDAVRGVDTILETESQVQGERKGTMRCHVVAVTVIIMTTMNIMTTIITLIN